MLNLSALIFHPVSKLVGDWSRSFGIRVTTEAAQACLYFAFSVLKLDEVVAFTAVQNRDSEAVMKRLGMQHRGYFNHPKLDQNSPLLRHTLYAIKPTDFLKNHDEYDLNQSIHTVQD